MCMRTINMLTLTVTDTNYGRRDQALLRFCIDRRVFHQTYASTHFPLQCSCSMEPDTAFNSQVLLDRILDIAF